VPFDTSINYHNVGKLEANKSPTNIQSSERMTTASGYPENRTQPSLLVVHRNLANPAPLGLLSFATVK
jgi:hypothetical protein